MQHVQTNPQNKTGKHDVVQRVRKRKHNTPTTHFMLKQRYLPIITHLNHPHLNLDPLLHFKGDYAT